MTWNAPVPRRTTATFPASVAIPDPPRARRPGKPHWGLRFVLLLFIAGGVTYFLRPSVPWIHARLTGVEAGVRGMAERYGLMTPAAVPAPAAQPVRAVTAPAEPTGTAAGEGASGRPDVTQLPPRPGMPAAMPQERPNMQRGPGNRRFARGQLSNDVAGGRPRGPALRARAAARRAAALRSSGRQRGAFAEPEVTFGDEEVPPAEPPPRAAPPPPPPPQAEARPPVQEAPAPAPAPERRSAVGEAMRSGDELDRLMASAVVESRATSAQGRPSRGVAGPVDQKQADADAEKAAARRADPAAPPQARVVLGRAEIQQVMKDVQRKMPDCFRRHAQEGAADVRVEVTPDGTVASTLVRGELANTPTAACVDAKIKESVFPASGGITFNYRLMIK
jgi:hypothetical protein